MPTKALPIVPEHQRHVVELTMPFDLRGASVQLMYIGSLGEIYEGPTAEGKAEGETITLCNDTATGPCPGTYRVEIRYDEGDGVKRPLPTDGPTRVRIKDYKSIQ